MRRTLRRITVDGTRAMTNSNSAICVRSLRMLTQHMLMTGRRSWMESTHGRHSVQATGVYSPNTSKPYPVS